MIAQVPCCSSTDRREKDTSRRVDILAWYHGAPDLTALFLDARGVASLKASLRGKFRLKQSAQRLFGPVKVRLGRGLRDAELLGNLAVAQVPGIAQQHDRAGPRGQRLDRLAEPLAQLVLFDLLLRLRMRVGKQEQGRNFALTWIQRELRKADRPLAAQFIQTAMTCDLADPPFERPLRS